MPPGVIKKPEVEGNLSFPLDITYHGCPSIVLYTVYPDKSIKVVKDDPDDDVFIECALAGDADYIVSGDKHLLDLKSYGKIKIVNAAEFIEMVGRR